VAGISPVSKTCFFRLVITQLLFVELTACRHTPTAGV
jgi:hypothetical protein